MLNFEGWGRFHEKKRVDKKNWDPKKKERNHIYHLSLTYNFHLSFFQFEWIDSYSFALLFVKQLIKWIIFQLFHSSLHASFLLSIHWRSYNILLEDMYLFLEQYSLKGDEALLFFGDIQLIAIRFTSDVEFKVAINYPIFESCWWHQWFCSDNYKSWS